MFTDGRVMCFHLNLEVVSEMIKILVNLTDILLNEELQFAKFCSISPIDNFKFLTKPSDNNVDLS